MLLLDRFLLWHTSVYVGCGRSLVEMSFQILRQERDVANQRYVTASPEDGEYEDGVAHEATQCYRHICKYE